jgi:hypothetical protein
VEHWRAEAEVEAEDDAGWSDQLHDCREIGERVQSLQADHDVARTACEHLEGAYRAVGAGVHQQGAGATALELGQLAKHGPLDGAPLDGIEIGDVALLRPEPRAKGPKQGDRVPFRAGGQHRPHRRVACALRGPGVHGEPAREVQHRDDSHDPY